MKAAILAGEPADAEALARLIHLAEVEDLEAEANRLRAVAQARKARRDRLEKAKADFLAAMPTAEEIAAKEKAAQIACQALEDLKSKAKDDRWRFIKAMAAEGILRGLPPDEDTGLSHRQSITGEEYITIAGVEYAMPKVKTSFSALVKQEPSQRAIDAEAQRLKLQQKAIEHMAREDAVRQARHGL